MSQRRRVPLLLVDHDVRFDAQNRHGESRVVFPRIAFTACGMHTLLLRLFCLRKQTSNDLLQVRALAIIGYGILQCRLVVTPDGFPPPNRQQSRGILRDGVADTEQDDFIVVQRRNQGAEFHDSHSVDSTLLEVDLPSDDAASGVIQ